VQKTLNVENSAADFDCPFRFCGMYEDAETGLCYNRHRYYDPSMGCYLSQDPIGLNGGAALYAYVHDPNSWIDPLGLLSAKELAAAQKMGANAETIAQKRYGFTKNTATVPSIEAGRYHIPDGMTDTTIFEVKCVGKQGYTRQIKSYVEKGRRDVVLIVDTDTKLSKPLQQMVDDGVIQLERTDLKNRTNAKTGCG
jgi:RHS repeat-associated protein